MLESRDLEFAYGQGTTHLSYPDIVLESQEQLLVLGRSGSGKSTLLGLWSGLLSPSAGSVRIDEVLLNSLSGTARDRWRSRQVGLVFQQPRLLPTQSIRNNIHLQRKIAGLPPDHGTIELSLKRLGIDHVADKLPLRCSLGEQQRAGILRALVHAPKLILADEPTSALDLENALSVAKLLKDEAKRFGASLVIVTHDDRLQRLFSRKLVLDSQVSA